MTDKIKKKLWDIDILVNEIKLFPQTYKTILKDEYNDGTCQTILRRKINKLCKKGIVCKTTIPGTRFGQVILYTIPKKYFVIVEAGRLKNKVYCFFKFDKVSNYYIRLNEYWILNKFNWNKKDDEKIVFEGNVLMMI